MSELKCIMESQITNDAVYEKLKARHGSGDQASF